MARDSFIFYRSYYEAMSGLKDKDRLQLYDAISELSLNGTEPKLTGICKNIFAVVKPQILANSERYENGKKGGRPKKETIGFEKTKTIGFQTKKPNVNVNDNVNDNVKAIDSCVDGLQDIINFYENNIGLLSPYGLETLQDYVKDMPTDLIILAMKKAVEADKRTIQYIKGILNNWHKKGIKTVLDAQKEEELFKKNNEKEPKKNYQNHEQRDVDEVDFSQFYANKTTKRSNK